MTEGAKKIGADEVGDGSGEERCSKLPLVTESIFMISGYQDIRIVIVT